MRCRPSKPLCPTAAAICLLSGDQAGASNVNPSSRLCTEIGRSLLPSEFATISATSERSLELRMKASRFPSGENVTAESTSEISFRGVPPTMGTRDRKSTRLNSSHGYISYAVFCLKKKKTRLIHCLSILTHLTILVTLH